MEIFTLTAPCDRKLAHGKLLSAVTRECGSPLLLQFPFDLVIQSGKSDK